MLKYGFQYYVLCQISSKSEQKQFFPLCLIIIIFVASKIVPDIMDNPVVKDIAAKHGKTPAQVLLRHSLQRGLVAIPKSTNPQRLKDNINVFDFQLDGEDMAKLNSEDKGPAARVCDFGFLKG